MHEGSIAIRIAKMVKEELVRRKVTADVEKIILKAGKLQAIIPESLIFHFDVIKKETPQLTNATLEIQQVPIVVECNDCHHVFEVRDERDPVFLCEKCEGTVKVKSGEELWIDSITVTDDPPDQR